MTGRRAVRAIREPRRALNRLDRLLAPLYGHRDFTRFIILSRSRTGSNLLASLLNSHPNVVVDGEILGRLDGRDPRRVLGGVFGRQGRMVQARGFKIFYYHPVDGSGEPIWEMLTADPELRVLHLKRKNLLRVLVSRKIAEARGLWSSEHGRSERSREAKGVFVRADEIRRVFDQTREWERWGDARFAQHSIHNLYYEDLGRDPDATLEPVLEWFDLPPAQLSTDFRRQNPEPLGRLIVNFDELRTQFRGDPLQEYFEG